MPRRGGIRAGELVWDGGGGMFRCSFTDESDGAFILGAMEVDRWRVLFFFSSTLYFKERKYTRSMAFWESC